MPLVSPRQALLTLALYLSQPENSLTPAQQLVYNQTIARAQVSRPSAALFTPLSLNTASTHPHPPFASPPQAILSGKSVRCVDYQIFRYGITPVDAGVRSAQSAAARTSRVTALTSLRTRPAAQPAGGCASTPLTQHILLPLN